MNCNNEAEVVREGCSWGQAMAGHAPLPVTSSTGLYSPQNPCAHNMGGQKSSFGMAEHPWQMSPLVPHGEPISCDISPALALTRLIPRLTPPASHCHRCFPNCKRPAWMLQ